MTANRLVTMMLVLTPASASATTELRAQELSLRPQHSAVWTTTALVSAGPVATAIDTIVYPPSHWREGLLVGGIAGALFGALLAGGLCADSDIAQDCTGEALRGALILGATGASLGALIGGLFPKRPEPDERTSQKAT